MIFFDKTQLTTYTSLFYEYIKTNTNIPTSNAMARELAALSLGGMSFNLLIEQLKENPVKVSLDVNDAFKLALFEKHEYTLTGDEESELLNFFLSVELDIIPVIDFDPYYIDADFKHATIKEAIESAKCYLGRYVQADVDISAYSAIAEIDLNGACHYEHCKEYEEDILSEFCDDQYSMSDLYDVEASDIVEELNYNLWLNQNAELVATAKAYIKNLFAKAISHNAMFISAGVDFNAISLDVLAKDFPEATAVLKQQYEGVSYLGIWRVLPMNLEKWQEGSEQPNVLVATQVCYTAIFNSGKWSFLGAANSESISVMTHLESYFSGSLDSLSLMHSDLSKKFIEYANKSNGSFEAYQRKKVLTNNATTLTLLQNYQNELGSEEIDVLNISFLLGEFQFVGAPTKDTLDFKNFRLMNFNSSDQLFIDVAELDPIGEFLSDEILKINADQCRLTSLLATRLKALDVNVHSFDLSK